MVDDVADIVNSSLIPVFSTFYLPSPAANGASSVLTKTDQTLQVAIQRLLDAGGSATSDSWARYFLLIVRHANGQFAEVFASADTLEHVTRRIQQLGHIAPAYNLGMQPVHLKLCQRWSGVALPRSPRGGVTSAEDLLTAHLQKVGWYAAKHIFYSRIEGSTLKQQVALDDCLTIANLKTSQPSQLLQAFELERCNTIKTYAERKLRGLITDTLQAQDISHRTKRQSPDGLLRSVPKWELQEALVAQGVSSQEGQRLQLVWQSYREIYHPDASGQQSLPPPTATQLECIGDRVNQRAIALHLVAQATAATIRADLNTLVQAVRRYRDLSAVNQRISEQFSDSHPGGLEELGRQEEREQMAAILTAAVQQCSAVEQATLYLRYGCHFNQAEILRHLGGSLRVKDQPAVCRRLKRIKTHLLQTVIQRWQQQDPALFRDRDLAILTASMMDGLDAWLEHYCRRAIATPLQTWFAELEAGDRALLDRHYGASLAVEDLALEVAVPPSALKTRLQTLRQAARQGVREWIETTMRLDSPLSDAVNAKLDHVAEAWLGDRSRFDS